MNELSYTYSLNDIDSAREFASLSLEKAEKINFTKGIASSYNNLAWIEWLQANNYPAMELYCKKAISLLEKNQHSKELAHSWFLLGCSYWIQAKFSQAAIAYETAGHIYSSLNDENGLANMYAFIAWVEEARGYYEMSLIYSVKWLDIAKKNNNYRYLDIWAALYRNIGDYNTSMDYYRQAAQFAKGTPHKDELAFFTQAIGEIFFLEEKYDSARYYYELASKYMSGNQNFLNARLGELFMAVKNYDSAFFYLNLDLNKAKKANALTQVMWSLLRLAKAYKETGNNSAALSTAHELLQTAKKTGARQYIRDGHFILFKIFLETGRRDNGFNHLQQYLVLKDTLDKDLSAQKLAFYKIRSEREKDQSRIDQLNNEKKLQHQQLNQAKQQKKFLMAGIAALFLLGFALLRNLILKRKNEKQRFVHELEIQTLESEKTKAALQHQATELEMQALRAQMNPHFIFNSLNSINRFILQNNKEQASEYLTKFSKLVRLILQNSNASLITLESELEALQLYLELESLRFNHRFSFKISVNDETDAEVMKVPPLIIQPYAENAIWHGLMHNTGIGNLEIEIMEEKSFLQIKISDDGIGRKKAAELKSKSAATHKSMGLKITEDRIAMMSKEENKGVVVINDLVLADGSNGGTEVILKIPLVQ
ncbi:MAG: histidine kinase [Chitinophagaceae bacterium]|nr:histidine kinase [Chitinophagaceae bacterium]